MNEMKIHSCIYLKVSSIILALKIFSKKSSVFIEKNLEIRKLCVTLRRSHKRVT